MTPPKYSLIVPTYNRLEELMELLPSINMMSEVDLLELIIVDDGSIDDTEGYVKSFWETLKLSIINNRIKGQVLLGIME